jgi:nitrate reductase (cytochrome), electron transfer subunit
MKKTILGLAILVALGSFSFSTAGENLLQSLRKNPIDGPEDPTVGIDWQGGSGTVERTFVHQPPVIPHSIQGFTLSVTQNDCLGCHGVPDSGMPKPHPSHYLDQEGQITESISQRWYFCTQCHVGQVDAEPLVENIFLGQ